MIKKIVKNIIILLVVAVVFTGCIPSFDFLKSESTMQGAVDVEAGETEPETEPPVDTTTPIFVEKVYVDFSTPYATYSIINDGYATLYRQNTNYASEFPEGTKPEDIIRFNKNKFITVAVNAGHGTKDGSRVKTFSHPDFTPKVTGGTTAEGEILSSAISDGMVFQNGMKEADADLLVANKLKEKLLNAGYSVLMIREDQDCRLDNIARTVLANKLANCHVAIHFDSTTSDKGIFYVVPFKNDSYLNMEPLKSNKDNIVAFGKCIINAFKDMGQKIWHESGTLQGDLTQLSYSTNPSVDVELGDKATVLNDENIEIFAEGIKRGIDTYFGDAYQG